MIMSLTCLNYVHTHSYALMYVCTHAHTHIPAFHRITSFLQISISFTLSLPWVVLVLVANFLFLFFPDCYQTVHSIISTSLIFIVVLPMLNPVSLPQKNKCVYPTLVASEIWLIQFSVWNDVSHLSADTIVMQHFQNRFS